MCNLETAYSEAAFIVAGDFNKGHLRKTLHKFYQHISCDYMRNTDRGSLLLSFFLGYAKQEQEAPVVWTAQYWSDQLKSMFQVCF